MMYYDPTVNWAVYTGYTGNLQYNIRTKKGSKGDDVKLVQKFLQFATSFTGTNYYSGGVSGVYDEQTYKAVLKYQNDLKFINKGVKSNGVVDALYAFDRLNSSGSFIVPINKI